MRWTAIAISACAALCVACAPEKDDQHYPRIEQITLTSGLSEDDPLLPGDFVNVEVWLDDPDGIRNIDSDKVFFFDGYLWINLERDPQHREHFRATHDIPCPDYQGAHLGAVTVFDKDDLATKRKFSLYYATSCELCNRPPELGQIYYWVNDTLDEDMTYYGASVEVYDFDDLGVTFDYNDPDCNLSNGEFWYSFDQGEWTKFEELLPDWLACSSQQSGKTYGLELPATEPGLHTWRVYWEDECGGHSNQRSGTYTVLEAF